MMLKGGCHCGNIGFDLEWPGDRPQIPARACDCSFCVKHGGVWTSHPQARLAVTIRDEAHVSRYAFASRTATFHICSDCGVVPLVTSELEGRRHAVVNVNALEGVDRAWLQTQSVTFEGEDVTSRLARRARNWISEVRIVTPASATSR